MLAIDNDRNNDDNHDDDDQMRKSSLSNNHHHGIHKNNDDVTVEIPPEIFINHNNDDAESNNHDEAIRRRSDCNVTNNTNHGNSNHENQPSSSADQLPVEPTTEGNNRKEVELHEKIMIPALLVSCDAKYEDEFAWEHDPYVGSPESKYKRYELPVSHQEGDRAMSIRLCSFRRPHMRAFHCAWISFFLAFVIWFAPAPLLKEIGTTLGLSKAQLWNSSIANDVAAVTLRIIIGPIVDQFGARIPQAIALSLAAIPCGMLGLVNTAAGLAGLRFCIGIAGCSFVMAQQWPTRMFAREIAGTANGTIAGWGNFGGAFTQLMMGRILFPLFKYRVYDGNSEKAWRTVCVIPASIAFLWASCFVWRISDDAPVGNYHEMRKHGTMDRIYYTTSIKSTVKWNTLILYIQYACCFGVEIVMNNGAVLYFIDQYGLTTEQASTLAFTYGSMNLLFRGLGGYISDGLNLRYGLRGRLWLQTILLFAEGATIVAFSYARSLPGAVITMIVFSIFTQASEGAIFGVVPYISKLYTGSVAGIVGSGGSTGSALYGLLFRSLPYRKAFFITGSFVMCSCLLTICLKIPMHASMLWGEDHISVIRTRNKFIAQSDQANVERAAQQHHQQQQQQEEQSQEEQSNNNNHDPETPIVNHHHHHHDEQHNA